ncbi:uncharacterized protein LOC117819767 [Notolabrus celidotus]|uniref:uncharacterized protein LOC117819767 n=1 Tax=Notolabrus celidotus TaxID=1203425 RepID=UPI00148F6111|nr:uncharacterized protein LOC117819767 [Notolabrus celidotus]
MKMTMTASVIFFIYLSFTLQPSRGFVVTQPESRTANINGYVIITCEHNVTVRSIIDVGLYSIPAVGERKLLCQDNVVCQDMVLNKESPNKCHFILFNIRPEAFSMKYQCEFTLNINEVHEQRQGRPTTLLQGQKDADCKTPPPSDPQRWTLLEFILLGLLALTLLYSCMFTCFHIRQRGNFQVNDIDENVDSYPEHSTYVDMRKGALLREPGARAH